MLHHVGLRLSAVASRERPWMIGEEGVDPTSKRTRNGHRKLVSSDDKRIDVE